MNFAADIPADLARAAHAGTSFVPEKRGQQEQAEYAATLAADYADLLKICDTDEKRAKLEEEFARYRAGLRRHFVAHLVARSRCMSSMITGPSNFPTRQNEKRNATERRRLNDLLEYRPRALAAIRRALQPELQPIMTGDADAADRLEAKIAKAEALQALMVASNAAIRKHKGDEAAQIAALVALGHTEERARRLLQPDFCNRIGFADYELSNNSANIRRMKGRAKVVEHNQAKPDTKLQGEHARIEDCPSENRVRLFFPGKPAAEVRDKLKSSGFRWAPSIGCWQAYRNSRTHEVAKAVAGVA